MSHTTSSKKSDPIEQIRQAEEKSQKAIEKTKADLKHEHSKKAADFELELEKAEKRISDENDKAYEAEEKKAESEATEIIARAEKDAETEKSSAEKRIERAAKDIVEELLATSSNQ